MEKYHSGYFVSLDVENITPKKYSNILKIKKEFTLISNNFKGSNWFVSFNVNKREHKIEFILNAKDQEEAQNVLFIVLCSSAVVDSVFVFSNEANYPFKLGTIPKKPNIFDTVNRPYVMHQSDTVPFYFKLACEASKNITYVTSLSKYALSIEMYSRHPMDIEDLNWKTTNLNFIQIRFAYAIIIAYSVIEELGFEIRASKEKPSKLGNGNWNPVVYNELTERLKRKIDINEKIPWLFRGKETKIEKNKPIKFIKKAEWSNFDEEENDIFLTNKDRYVDIQDAIWHISYLRSKISSHKVGDRIYNLSVFDVANAQFVARRLILESLNLWNDI